MPPKTQPEGGPSAPRRSALLLVALGAMLLVARATSLVGGAPNAAPAQAAAQRAALGTGSRNRPLLPLAPSTGESSGSLANILHLTPPKVGRAQSNQVLGLAVGESGPSAVQSWAATHGLTCREEPARAVAAGQQTSELLCSGQQPGALHPAYTRAQAISVALALDARDKLHQVEVHATFEDATHATHALHHMLAEARKQAGHPTYAVGDATAHFLQADMLRQARVEFFREDLFTRVSATNMGSAFAVMHAMRTVEPGE